MATDTQIQTVARYFGAAFCVGPYQRPPGYCGAMGQANKTGRTDLPKTFTAVAYDGNLIIFGEGEV